MTIKTTKKSLLITSLLLMALIVSPACQKAPAEFEIASLEIAPPEVAAGETVTISAEVKNAGGSEGRYSAILTVDGVEVETKDITVALGATETVHFELVQNVVGTYILEVAGQTAEVRVIGAGFLGQDLASLEDSNGKIVSLEPLRIESPYIREVEVNKLRYLSDGLEVVGFLVKPKENDVKYPALIFNRGGNREYGKIEDPLLAYYLSYLSASGYVVVASQYRGNDGGQGREEFGGSNRNDVLNLIPLLDSLPFVDSSKIAMLGFSRGGMMTYIAISMTDKVKAAAVVGGVTDLIQMYNEREQGMKQVCIELIGGTPKEKEAEYKERSAYFWPEKINTPVLILHGGADWRVKVTQAEKLGGKLKELGKVYELVIYPGGDHGLNNNREDRNDRILKWFATYLK